MDQSKLLSTEGADSFLHEVVTTMKSVRIIQQLAPNAVRRQTNKNVTNKQNNTALIIPNPSLPVKT